MLPQIKHKIQFRETGLSVLHTHSIAIQFNEKGFVIIGTKCSEIVEENFSEMVRGTSSFSLTNLVCTIYIEKWLQASKNLLVFCINEIV